MNAFTSVYIVDDDKCSLELLQILLEQNYAVKVIGTANDTLQALSEIIELAPNLIFLDIELPSMTGLEFCKELQNWLQPDTKIVFYSAHDKYILEALRRQAFDYLLKPPTSEDLAQIMTRFYEHKLSTCSQVSGVTQDLPTILVLNAYGEHVALHFDDVAYFSYNGDRRIWEVITLSNEVFPLRHRTTAETILNYSPLLVQIHKRCIVNTNKIVKICNDLCIMEKPCKVTEELRISKLYRKDIPKVFYNM